MGATLIGFFIVFGGVAAAIQGASVAYDWGCRLGWVHDYCPATPPARTPLGADLPA